MYLCIENTRRNDRPRVFFSIENKHHAAQIIIRTEGKKRYKSHCQVNKIRREEKKKKEMYFPPRETPDVKFTHLKSKLSIQPFLLGVKLNMDKNHVQKVSKTSACRVVFFFFFFSNGIKLSNEWRWQRIR